MVGDVMYRETVACGWGLPELLLGAFGMRKLLSDVRVVVIRGGGENRTG